MRATLAYTSARILLLVISVILLYLVGARGLLLLALAFLVSGIASFVLLSRQRDVMSRALMARIAAGRRRASEFQARIKEGARAEDEDLRLPGGLRDVPMCAMLRSLPAPHSGRFPAVPWSRPNGPGWPDGLASRLFACEALHLIPRRQAEESWPRTPHQPSRLNSYASWVSQLSAWRSYVHDR